MKKNILNAVAMLTVGFAVSLILAFPPWVHADISNPHPTPPANTVTNAMLVSGAVTDSKVAATAAIQLLKIGTSADNKLIPFGSGGALGTSTSLLFDSNGPALITQGIISTGASTTLNHVHYQFPSAQGSSAQALTNDGSGNLSWATPGGTFTSATYTAGEALSTGDAVYLATTTGQFANASAGGASLTIAYTVSTYPNRLLLCWSQGDLTDTNTTVTYNGVSMTALATLHPAADRFTHVFYLVNPASGTHNAVFTGQTNVDSNCADYYHINQTNAFDATTTASGTGTTVTSSVTAASANEIQIAICASAGACNVAGANTTLRLSGPGGTDSLFDFGGLVGSAGSHTLNITNANVAFDVLGATFRADSSGGIVYKASAAQAITANTFIGFAQSAIARYAAGTIITGGQITGLTNISPGMQYYLNDTFGSTSPTVGTVTRKVGISDSATSLQITNVW